MLASSRLPPPATALRSTQSSRFSLLLLEDGEYLLDVRILPPLPTSPRSHLPSVC